MKQKLLLFSKILICIFAVIGFVLTSVYFAVKFGFTNEKGIVDLQRNAFLASVSENNASSSLLVAFGPANTEEWSVFKVAVLKDQAIITKAADKADISPRLLVANLAVEQLRLFVTDREVYKEIFAPLKILGVQSQFSWGVMGIKPDTAKEVEQNLTSSSSVFYPGIIYEHLLDFSTNNPDQERFDRLTDQHDRYYSYLYAALYIKEIESQWSKAGFDISANPGVLSTLYNIGFDHSIPNANPQIGGAEIDIASSTYSFGGLAAQFYYSDELIEQFPR